MNQVEDPPNHTIQQIAQILIRANSLFWLLGACQHIPAFLVRISLFSHDRYSIPNDVRIGENVVKIVFEISTWLFLLLKSNRLAEWCVRGFERLSLTRTAEIVVVFLKIGGLSYCFNGTEGLLSFPRIFTDYAYARPVSLKMPLAFDLTYVAIYFVMQMLFGSIFIFGSIPLARWAINGVDKVVGHTTSEGWPPPPLPEIDQEG